MDFTGKSQVPLSIFKKNRFLMLERILQIDKGLDGSVFLFGARQTGKSTILRNQFPNAIYIDLLNTEVKARFSRRPALLYEMLGDKPSGEEIFAGTPLAPAARALHDWTDALREGGRSVMVARIPYDIIWEQ